MSKRFIMANLVYGQIFPQLWLENQLKSLCDETNLPKLKEQGYTLEYVLFTDEITLQAVSRHPNFMRLGQLCELNIVKVQWPADADQFGSRYPLLVQMFQNVLPVALEKNAYMGSWVADLVFAKEALPRMLKRLEDGHDGVFMVPIRSAADSVNHILSKMPGAPTDLELFELAFKNLHHLWTHCTYGNPYYSRMPYSMLWNSGTGLLAHNFGITPIVFKPNEEMRKVQGVIDADVPIYCKNPYWCEDWIDAPVAGVEPLSNGHYPPFEVGHFNIDKIVDWSRKGTMPMQQEYLPHALYYPSKKTFNSPEITEQALNLACTIQAKIVGDLK